MVVSGSMGNELAESAPGGAHRTVGATPPLTIEEFISKINERLKTDTALSSEERKILEEARIELLKQQYQARLHQCVELAKTSDSPEKLIEATKGLSKEERANLLASRGYEILNGAYKDPTKSAELVTKATTFLTRAYEHATNRGVVCRLHETLTQLAIQRAAQEMKGGAKPGRLIEDTSKLDHVFFEKLGTLSKEEQGKLEVVQRRVTYHAALLSNQTANVPGEAISYVFGLAEFKGPYSTVLRPVKVRGSDLKLGDGNPLLESVPELQILSEETKGDFQKSIRGKSGEALVDMAKALRVGIIAALSNRDPNNGMVSEKWDNEAFRMYELLSIVEKVGRTTPGASVIQVGKLHEESGKILVRYFSETRDGSLPGIIKTTFQQIQRSEIEEVAAWIGVGAVVGAGKGMFTALRSPFKNPYLGAGLTAFGALEGAAMGTAALAAKNFIVGLPAIIDGAETQRTGNITWTETGFNVVGTALDVLTGPVAIAKVRALNPGLVVDKLSPEGVKQLKQIATELFGIEIKEIGEGATRTELTKVLQELTRRATTELVDFGGKSVALTGASILTLGLGTGLYDLYISDESKKLTPQQRAQAEQAFFTQFGKMGLLMGAQMILHKGANKVFELDPPKLDPPSLSQQLETAGQALKFLAGSYWNTIPVPSGLGSNLGNVFGSMTREFSPLRLGEGQVGVANLVGLGKSQNSRAEFVSELGAEILQGKITLDKWTESATKLIDLRPETKEGADRATSVRAAIGQIALETRRVLQEKGLHDLGGGVFSQDLNAPKVTARGPGGEILDDTAARKQRPKSFELADKLEKADRGELEISQVERVRSIRLINAYNRLDDYLGKIVKHLDGSEPQPGKVLRQHQYEALLAIQGFLERGDTAGYVKLPTGTGKTALFVELSEILGLRTLICVPRNLLGTQSAASFHEWAPGVDVGIVDGSAKEYGRQTTITTYQSLGSQLKLGETRTDQRAGAPFGIHPDDFDLVLFDEAHRSLGEVTQEHLQKFNDKARVGFTATPDFNEAKRVENFLGQRLYDMEISDAIQRGLLSGVQIVHQRTEVDLSQVKVRTDGEYVTGYASEEQLARAVNIPARNAYALKNYKKFLMPEGDPINGERTLVYCVNIKHAEEMAELFRNEGIPAAAVSSKNTPDEKKEILRKLKSGEIRVVMNADLLIEGFDEPKISAIINAAPTLSLVNAEQRGGRGLRLDSDDPSKVLFIIELVDQFTPDGSPPITFDQIIAGGVLLPQVNGNGTSRTTEDPQPRIRPIPIDAQSLNLVANPEEVLRAGNEMEYIRSSQELERIRRNQEREEQKQARIESDRELRTQGYVPINDLARQYDTSTESIRRRIESLGKKFQSDEGQSATALGSPVEYLHPDVVKVLRKDLMYAPDNWINWAYVKERYDLTQQQFNESVSSALKGLSEEEQEVRARQFRLRGGSSRELFYELDFIKSLELPLIPKRDPEIHNTPVRQITVGFDNARLQAAQTISQRLLAEAPGERFIDERNSGAQYYTRDLTKKIMVELGNMFPPPTSQMWTSNLNSVIAQVQAGTKNLSKEDTIELLKIVIKDKPNLAWHKSDGGGKVKFISFQLSLIDEAVDYATYNTEWRSKQFLNLGSAARKQ